MNFVPFGKEEEKLSFLLVVEKNHWAERGGEEWEGGRLERLELLGMLERLEIFQKEEGGLKSLVE